MSDDNKNEPEPEQESKPVYEVTLDQESLQKGSLIQIPGLGTFENGSTFEVNEDQHATYRAHHQEMVMVLDDNDNPVLDDNGAYTFELQQGPTLLQASKGMNGVEVTTVLNKKQKEGDS